jgi:hypothetical protein
VHNASRIIGLHAVQDEQRAARHAHIDQRLLIASAKASHAGEIKVGAAALNDLYEGVV